MLVRDDTVVVCSGRVTLDLVRAEHPTAPLYDMTRAVEHFYGAGVRHVYARLFLEVFDKESLEQWGRLARREPFRTGIATLYPETVASVPAATE